jgi:predicted transcriptional regulator
MAASCDIRDPFNRYEKLIINYINLLNERKYDAVLMIEKDIKKMKIDDLFKFSSTCDSLFVDYVERKNEDSKKVLVIKDLLSERKKNIITELDCENVFLKKDRESDLQKFFNNLFANGVLYILILNFTKQK